MGSRSLSRVTKTKLALVRGGFANSLTCINYVDWHVVKTPAEAHALGELPLVIDFKNPDLSDDWERYIAQEAISGRAVFNAKQLSESLTGRVQINHLSENTFGHLSPDSIYEPAKRYVDTVIALCAIVFLMPLFIVTVLAIKLDSTGPVIFKQKRIGYRGQEFTLWKFRSMSVAETSTDNRDADMTQSDDDRITGVGRFIRKTRIDELPQLFNILRGEMSWIGPRPETLRLSAWYENEIPFYPYRHIVRPGITGWAQVKQGHVTTVRDVRTKLEYDLYYVKNFSIWLDLLIVVQTIRVVLTGHGAK